MLELLERWWNSAEQGRSHERALELTLIRLMLGMMKQDGKLAMDEHEACVRLLVRRFAIGREAAEQLFEEAEQAEAKGPGLEQLAQRIGGRYNWVDLAELLDDIWCVAEADGHIDSLDEHYVQRIGKLLGMPLTGARQQRRAA